MKRLGGHFLRKRSYMHVEIAGDQGQSDSCGRFCSVQVDNFQTLKGQIGRIHLDTAAFLKDEREVCARIRRVGPEREGLKRGKEGFLTE